MQQHPLGKVPPQLVLARHGVRPYCHPPQHRVRLDRPGRRTGGGSVRSDTNPCPSLDLRVVAMFIVGGLIFGLLAIVVVVAFFQKRGQRGNWDE